MRIVAPAARSALRRAALLAGVCLSAVAILVPNAAYTQDATWNGATSDWNTPGNWTPASVPTNMATFSNTDVTGLTISSNTSINTMEFTAVAPAYSFTIQNGATFTINSGTSNSSSFFPGFTVNTGAALTIGNAAFVEMGSLAGGGTVTIGPSSSGHAVAVLILRDARTRVRLCGSACACALLRMRMAEPAARRRTFSVIPSSRFQTAHLVLATRWRPRLATFASLTRIRVGGAPRNVRVLGGTPVGRAILRQRRA